MLITNNQYIANDILISFEINILLWHRKYFLKGFRDKILSTKVKFANVKIAVGLTSSLSSTLRVILSSVSPTRWKSLIIPALLKAEVLVDLGRSPSFSRNSIKSASDAKEGCVEVRTKYLKQIFHPELRISSIQMAKALSNV